MDDTLRPETESVSYHTNYGQVVKVGPANQRALKLEDGLITGNLAIDDDHRHLIELIDDFRQTVESNRADSSVGQLLCDLASYAAEHFDREETFMRRFRYSEADQHRAEHDRFLSDLGELVVAFDSGRPGVADETLDFLIHWWIDHMTVWDRQLVAFMRSDSVAADQDSELVL